MISNPGPTPPGAQHTVTAIDRAIAGDCPCGAQPRLGSAYCGPDCEPTHLTPDSDTNGPGQVSQRHGVATPMRWRPDLVTAADDTDLTLWTGPMRLGGFTRNIYHRDGTDLVHLRLDDGYRWVGTDVERRDGGEEFAGRCFRAWQRLERELTARASADDGGDPWADTHPADTAESLLREIRQREIARTRLGLPNWERRCRACGKYGEPVDGVRPAGPPQHFGYGIALVDLEACQACPHCRLPHPGPVLHMGVGYRHERGEWHYRLRATVGDRKYAQQIILLESRLVAARDRVAYVRWEWDRMERLLLRRIADDAAEREQPGNTVAGLLAAGAVDVAPAGSDLNDPTAWRNVGHTTRDGLTS